MTAQAGLFKTIKQTYATARQRLRPGTHSPYHTHAHNDADEGLSGTAKGHDAKRDTKRGKTSNRNTRGAVTVTPATASLRAVRTPENENARPGFALGDMLRHAERQDRLQRFKKLGIAAVICAGLSVPVLLVLSGASWDFTLLITVMLLMCGLFAYDILSRRLWEKDAITQIQRLTGNHDRLVREVARNRNDLAGVKSGLALAAQNVEIQGKKYAPSSSIEARMIEMIVEQLSAIGARPRPAIESGPDAHILELEVAPPTPRPALESALDAAFSTSESALPDSVILDLIRHAIRHDTIDVFMQPIVSLPQRKTRLYEVFARVRAQPGQSVPAARYLELARAEQLLPAIDNLLLLRCLQLLRDSADTEDDVPFILNISGATLNDRSFMNDLVTFLSAHHPMARRLIFEMTQQDFAQMDQALDNVMDGLSRLGCRFSMDGIRQRRLDVRELKNRHIRFIKLDAAWLAKESAQQTGFARLARFKKSLDAAGIDLIVEKIENEILLKELLDHNIDFGQGYLFGKPDIAAAWLD